MRKRIYSYLLIMKNEKKAREREKKHCFQTDELFDAF
jgi:hypothetical protein